MTSLGEAVGRSETAETASDDDNVQRVGGNTTFEEDARLEAGIDQWGWALRVWGMTHLGLGRVDGSVGGHKWLLGGGLGGSELFKLGHGGCSIRLVASDVGELREEQETKRTV